MSILSSTNSGTKNLKITREILKEKGFVYRGRNHLLFPYYSYGTLEIYNIIIGNYFTTNFPGLEDFVIESMYDLEMILKYYKAFQELDKSEMSKIKIDLVLENQKKQKL